MMAPLDARPRRGSGSARDGVPSGSVRSRAKRASEDSLLWLLAARGHTLLGRSRGLARDLTEPRDVRPSPADAKLPTPSDPQTAVEPVASHALRAVGARCQGLGHDRRLLPGLTGP